MHCAWPHLFDAKENRAVDSVAIPQGKLSEKVGNLKRIEKWKFAKRKIDEPSDFGILKNGNCVLLIKILWSVPMQTFCKGGGPRRLIYGNEMEG